MFILAKSLTIFIVISIIGSTNPNIFRGHIIIKNPIIVIIDESGIINKFENKNVNEIVPKIYNIIGKIKICAEIELIIIFKIYRIMLFPIISFIFFIQGLPKIIIPKNPKYDSNTLKLLIECGLFNKIISNEIPKLFAMSYLLNERLAIKLIIHIIHALIIDGVNPVRNIN